VVRVTEGHQQPNHLIECIRFPIQLIETAFHRFQVIARYLSKAANFNLLHLHLAPLFGVTPNFAEIFAIKKTRIHVGYLWRCLRDPINLAVLI